MLFLVFIYIIYSLIVKVQMMRSLYVHIIALIAPRSLF